jgi:hypothetical protein
MFAQYLAVQSPIFDINSCKYAMEKSKETTARIVLRREFGILNSFTLESTYCGMDIGDKKGLQIQLSDFEKVGADFGRAINLLLNQTEYTNLVSVVDSLPKPSSGSSSLVNTPKRIRKSKKITGRSNLKKKECKSAGNSNSLNNYSNEKDNNQSDQNSSSEDDGE